MDTSATAVSFKDNKTSSEPHAQEMMQLIEAAMTVKQHVAAWEQSIEHKLTATEQILDKQLMQIQMVIMQFNRTLQSTVPQDWQQASSAINNESQQQTTLLQEACAELKKTTKEIQGRVERTAHHITKNLNNTMQGLRAGELQQLVEDSAVEVKTFTTAATSQVNHTLKWFHWKNLGLVFLVSLVVTVLVSLYIDDEWPWETHKVVMKQRLAGQAVLTAWPQLTQLDRQQIADDFA